MSFSRLVHKIHYPTSTFITQGIYFFFLMVNLKLKLIFLTPSPSRDKNSCRDFSLTFLRIHNSIQHILTSSFNIQSIFLFNHLFIGLFFTFHYLFLFIVSFNSSVIFSMMTTSLLFDKDSARGCQALTWYRVRNILFQLCSAPDDL